MFSCAFINQSIVVYIIVTHTHKKTVIRYQLYKSQVIIGCTGI